MDQTTKRAVPLQSTNLVQKTQLDRQAQPQTGLTVNTTARPVTNANPQPRSQLPSQQARLHPTTFQPHPSTSQQAPQQSTRTTFRQAPVKKKTSPFLALYAETASDPQYVFEYCEDIHLALLTAEQKYLVTSDYMLSQSNITPKYREVLVDWLSSVRSKYRLKIDTFALCLSILDRFLERREISKDKLQLVGCTALWIAAKYEEIYPPELEDLVLISDRNFTREQFIMMERIILTILNFNVTVPYAHHFAERFVTALPNSQYPEETKTLIQNIAFYIIESSYQHYTFVGHLSSQIAAASVSLALYFTQQAFHYPTVLQQASGYFYSDIVGLFESLWQSISQIQKLHELKREQIAQGLKPSKVFDSVYRLYMTDVWLNAPQHVTEFNAESIPPVDQF